MDTKTVKDKIRFEKGIENEVYKYEIDKISGISYYLGDWLLGVPRTVDMKFTKKFGRARMKVAVLDPNLIPNLVDIVIGDFVYELQFRVEQDMSDGEPQVIDMDSTTDEDKENGKKKEDPMNEDGKKEEELKDNAPSNHSSQLPNSG